VEGASVEYQAEVGADVGLTQSRHVGVHDPNVDASLPNALAGALQGLIDDVDAGDLPAALCQWHTPNTTAASEVECRSKGRLAAALLALE
jgi:hypothetical protein